MGRGEEEPPAPDATMLMGDEVLQQTSLQNPFKSLTVLGQSSKHSYDPKHLLTTTYCFLMNSLPVHYSLFPNLKHQNHTELTLALVNTHFVFVFLFVF